jgi:hypothetical protein
LLEVTTANFVVSSEYAAVSLATNNTALTTHLALNSVRLTNRPIATVNEISHQKSIIFDGFNLATTDFSVTCKFYFPAAKRIISMYSSPRHIVESQAAEQFSALSSSAELNEKCRRHIPWLFRNSKHLI